MELPSPRCVFLDERAAPEPERLPRIFLFVFFSRNRTMLNPQIASANQAIQKQVDRILRLGLRSRSISERRAEREIAYADHLKILIEEVREIDGTTA